MTFRSLDISGYRPAAPADQMQPSLLWVDVANLLIDTRYQRQITPKGRAAIQRIADGWSWKAYQPILVAPSEGGKIAVVDGQHRAHAAAVAGIGQLPAMLVPMTPSEQAAAFTAVNTAQIKLNKAALYKAQLVAGDPLAIAAGEAVRAADCVLMTYNPTATQRRPGQVFAHKLIMRMVADGEAEAVTVGLRAIRHSQVGNAAADAYGGLRVYDAATLAVWLPALAKSQRFLRLDLPEVFDSLDLDTMFDLARQHARISGGSARARVMGQIEAALRAADAARAAA